jgi:phosphopantothenoylcysteine decarboxylase/phosphopantothenate--cysteine ligase
MLVSILSGRRIVLGVTGGIAAYKAAELASQLVQAGALVDVILTENAQRFIGAVTFQALTKRPVHNDTFEGWTEESTGHVSLAQGADLLVVAPGTANAISKLAHGAADDMLTTTALAMSAPLLIAPAMEQGMFHHPATQANITLLKDRGTHFVGPETGRLASGAVGEGRLAEIPKIVDTIRALLGKNGPLAGRRVVLTAGGTQEAVDPVRFLGNRSSGQMGYALAHAAIDAGASVTLITGPTTLRPPATADVIQIVSAAELEQATKQAVEHADVLIMAAAVADFRPAEPSSSKIKKGTANKAFAITLVRNPDILASIDCPELVKVGFAAETEDLIPHAWQKLREKRLSMIVANDALATIGSQRSTAVLITADDEPEQLPELTKESLAEEIVDRVAQILRRRES